MLLLLLQVSSWLWPPLVKQSPDSLPHALALASSLSLSLPISALFAKPRSINPFGGVQRNSSQALDGAEERRLHSGVRYVTQEWE